MNKTSVSASLCAAWAISRQPTPIMDILNSGPVEVAEWLVAKGFTLLHDALNH